VPFQPPGAKTLTPAAPPATAAATTAEAAPARAGGQTAAPRPSTRGGKRVVSIFVTPATWRQLRLMCLDEQKSLQDLMVEAIDALFERRGLARIAAEPPASAE
jgi:predicted GNAT superfamily acetyltransferase